MADFAKASSMFAISPLVLWVGGCIVGEAEGLRMRFVIKVKANLGLLENGIKIKFTQKKKSSLNFPAKEITKAYGKTMRQEL